MPTQLRLRKVLPISQTLLAVAFGGWGSWERVTSINDSWLGWNSTLRFHVWPWPFKFAVVQNTPAFLADSGRCRSAFRDEADHCSVLIPIRIPLSWRSSFRCDGDQLSSRPGIVIAMARNDFHRAGWRWTSEKASYSPKAT
jgi:hypothetical protein